MKNKTAIIYILVAGLFTTTSCYYDKYDQLYGKTTVCDTSGIASYAQKVVPILQQQCYGCHSGAGASGGITMGNYSADKALALNGKLYGTISWTQGFSPMPKFTPKMSSCTILTIKRWIDAGAPNN
jgi:mono/diheme cytochrome c family protein